MITTILEIKNSNEQSFVLNNAVPPISIPFLPALSHLTKWLFL